MIPENIDITYDNNVKEEDEYFNFRKEYQNIYQNLFNVPCIVEYILNSLNNQFSKLKQKNNNGNKIHEIELPLFLINTLHQVQGKNVTDINLLKVPFYSALEINFIAFDSEIIILAYHEMLQKFINFYISDENYLKIVMGIYLGEKGIMSPNLKIGSKVSVIFCKFIEKSKANISSLAVDTVVKLKPILDSLVDCKNINVCIKNKSCYRLLLNTPTYIRLWVY